MSGDVPVADGPLPLPGWQQFCELHARAAAAQFARSFRLFVSENPRYESVGAETSFCQHFVAHFLRSFAVEISCLPVPGSPSNPSPATREPLRRDMSDSLESVEPALGQAARLRHMANLGHSRSSEDVSTAQPRFKKGFSLRNMSLCVVDGVRDMLQWGGASGEPLLDAPQGHGPDPGDKSEGEKWSHRLRLTKASSPRVQLLDIQREGTLRYTMADDANSANQWHKCRLLLRKAANLQGERFLLEFYSPPKSSKPRVSVPLSAIVEVRTTMPLEMPDKDNTFVLKVGDGAEYILETLDSLQKHSWVADIQGCRDPGESEDDQELSLSLPSCPLPTAAASGGDTSSDGGSRVPDGLCTNPDTASLGLGRAKESPKIHPPAHIPLESFLQTLPAEPSDTTAPTGTVTPCVSPLLHRTALSQRLSHLHWIHCKAK
uniref:SH2B adaptor protein 2 n=1 Tax=Callorhinchus milii TaxID=7868 RepID=A0A4W3IGE3_CALMI